LILLPRLPAYGNKGSNQINKKNSTHFFPVSIACAAVPWKLKRSSFLPLEAAEITDGMEWRIEQSVTQLVISYLLTLFTDLGMNSGLVGLTMVVGVFLKSRLSFFNLLNNF